MDELLTEALREKNAASATASRARKNLAQFLQESPSPAWTWSGDTIAAWPVDLVTGA
jgi:hypothetical protein